MRFQAGEIFLVRGQPAPGRDHGFSSLRQLGNNLPLPVSKRRLAILSENLINAFSSARLDNMVGIEKRKMQRRSKHLAGRRFSGAHEADKGDVLELPSALHARNLTK